MIYVWVVIANGLDEGPLCCLVKRGGGVVFHATREEFLVGRRGSEQI